MSHFPTDILIAGQWRRGAGEPAETVDPATGRVLATVSCASADEVDEAAEAAAKAMADPAWRDLLPHERARLLHRIAELTEQAAGELSALQTADTGKTLTETRALALSAAGTFRYMAAALETAEDTVTPSRGAYLTMSVHEPIGVVGAINPWNSPVASDAQKIAPALAAGNAVLLKPAAWTPLVSLALGRLITRALDESGLPAALLSVLPGSGRVVGDAIVRHPLVARVGFTGGTETGRSIAALAAKKLIPASLELGGKSPTIVRADADVEQALAGVLFGIFSSSGQSCIAGSRLFVAREIYDSFVGELVERVRNLRVGPGTEPGTQVGPLVHHRHLDAVAAYVDLARSEGARVLCGGSAPEGERHRDGAYYLPTVLDGLPNTSRTCPRRRSSARSSWPSPTRTRTTWSARPTTPSTGWPAASGPATRVPRGGSPGASRRAPCGSTRTSSSAPPPRSPAGRTAAWARRRAATRSARTSARSPCTGAPPPPPSPGPTDPARLPVWRDSCTDPRPAR